jgi:hypothetical protein
MLTCPPWVWPLTVSAAHAGTLGNRSGSWLRTISAASSGTPTRAAAVSGTRSVVSASPATHSGVRASRRRRASFSRTGMPAPRSAVRTASPPVRQSWLPSTATRPSGARIRPSACATAAGRIVSANAASSST